MANADKLAAEALESPHVRASIKKRWGDGVDHPDGSVNREAIAHLIFDDEMERRWLESIIHPHGRADEDIHLRQPCGVVLGHW